MRSGIRNIKWAAIVAVVAVMPLTSSHAAEPNLILNPGFESSPVPPDARAFNQPVLPTGWLVEGSSALFDHTPQNPKAGQYAAAISGSYSGPPRKECSVQCTDVPGSAQRDAVYAHYSVAPSWRSAQPFAVTAGTTYRFSTWVRLSIPKDGTGAAAYVRWLDSNGLLISRANGPSLLASVGGASYATFVGGAYTDKSTDWVYRATTLTAPAGAASAVVVLSYTDDMWIGQVVYDQVCFAKRVSATTPTICDTTFGP